MTSVRSRQGNAAAAVLAAVLGTAAVTTGGSAAPAAATDGDGSVILLVERVENDFAPGTAFNALIMVDLSGVPGVTSVAVVTPTGAGVDLQNEDGDDEWEAEAEFTDLASVKAAVNGTWTIQIDGAAPSTSTFTLNAATLEDADLLAVPTLLEPVSGAESVAADVVFSWSDPSAADVADAIFVSAENDQASWWQDDDSMFGSLSVDDTTWAPPLELPAGESRFSVLYVAMDGTGRAGGLVVTDGAITWGRSPFAPPDYPDATPLLVLGAERVISFVVGAPCPGDLDGDSSIAFADLLAVLSAWGPCGDCPQDLDDSGAVGFGDLLAILSAWGPCP